MAAKGTEVISAITGTGAPVQFIKDNHVFFSRIEFLILISFNIWKMETRLICMRVVRNMTKNGKLMRFNATVAAGTGNGGLGIASATHASAQDAIFKAGRIATKKIEYFDRWQDRTLFHDDIVKFKASKLIVRPAPPSISPYISLITYPLI